MTGAIIGAVLTGFFPDSVRDAGVLRRALEVSAGLGFGSVEFFYDGPENRSVAEDLRGSALVSVYHPAYAMKREGLDLGAESRAERERAVASVKAWIEQASVFGCGTVMLLSGPERETAAERDAASAALADSLRGLCAFAAAASPPIRIHLESFNHRGEPYLLMGPTARCLALADAVGAAGGNFALTFDLSHCLQLGEDPSESLGLLSGRCRHVHLADCVIRDRTNPLFGDKHPPFGTAGGEVDEAYLAAFLRRLNERGFFARDDRPTLLGLEVITRPPAEPARTIMEAKAAFDRALGAAGLA